MRGIFTLLFMCLACNTIIAQTYTQDREQFEKLLQKELKTLDPDKKYLVAFRDKAKGYSYSIEDLDYYYNKNDFEALRPMNKMVNEIALQLYISVDMEFKIFRYPMEMNGEKVNFYDYRRVPTHKRN